MNQIHSIEKINTHLKKSNFRSELIILKKILNNYIKNLNVEKSHNYISKNFKIFYNNFGERGYDPSKYSIGNFEPTLLEYYKFHFP